MAVVALLAFTVLIVISRARAPDASKEPELVAG
jgi:hypothetical protein